VRRLIMKQPKSIDELESGDALKAYVWGDPSEGVVTGMAVSACAQGIFIRTVHHDFTR
jgi:hypothetical protein